MELQAELESELKPELKPELRQRSEVKHLEPARYSNWHRCFNANNPAQADAFCEAFDPHTLAAQDRAALMNRVDSKYAIRLDQMAKLVADIQESYTILEINQCRLFTYENIYFDTADRQLFRWHHSGKLNRYKLRLRHYVETDNHFLELKRKNNKRRTIKTRVELVEGATSDVASTFMRENFCRDQHLVPSLLVNYRRATLMHRSVPERLTIDFNVQFCDASYGQEKADSVERLGNTVVIEHKRSGKAESSQFLNFVQKERLRPVGLSKYCIGSCLTNPTELKHNRFKPVLSRLKQLNNIVVN